jgi:8-oxo-dGTP diphosphatase
LIKAEETPVFEGEIAMSELRKIDVVGAVIYDDKKNRYLVTMRDKNKYQGGLWEFPGGKIEAGETNEEALVREIKEELACSIRVGKLIEDYTCHYPELTVRLITYLCRIEEGAPKLSEHESMKWVTAEEMKTLSFPEADVPTVNRIAEGISFD